MIMNIEVEGYTREQILAALFSSSRIVRYEYVAFNSQGECLGNVEIQNGVVSFDSTSEVMRTFTGTMKESDVINSDSIDVQIIPYMCLMMFNNKEAKFPLGRFIITTSKNLNNGINMLNISGYDLGKIALDDKIDEHFTALNTQTYKQALMNLLENLYSRIEIVDDGINKSYTQVWEMGVPKITVANDLLKAMNYFPLHFDSEGKALCIPYILPSEKGIDFTYIADKTSVIIDGITAESDKFMIPNKWIRYTENPEVEYLMEVFVNDNPKNPYSTVNRKRFVVDSQSVNDISNATNLRSLLKREVELSMQETETLNFTTLNMPGHGYREVLYIEVDEYNIHDVFVEVSWEMNLEAGGVMTHVCKRVVNIWD